MLICTLNAITVAVVTPEVILKVTQGHTGSDTGSSMQKWNLDVNFSHMLICTLNAIIVTQVTP